MANADLSAERLRERLHYAPDTGTFRWKVSAGSVKAGDEAGFLISGGYKQIKLNQRFYLAHRLAWLYVHGCWPSGVLDHMNGSRADNRIANLREGTHRLNNENRRKASSRSLVGLLGVSARRNKSGVTYVAFICINGKRRNLGTTATAEEAHELYLDAKRKHHEGNTL